MRLLTHNLLMCNKGGCSGFPLTVTLAEPEELEKRRQQRIKFVENEMQEVELQGLKAHEILEAEMNPVFVKNMLTKLDYPVLVDTASQLGMQLPPKYEEPDLSDERFLQLVHHAINEFHVLEGFLTCPKCQQQFVVRDGIPDMVETTD
eukprot:Protomagalhaensia_sp_Gyna_25__2275@NODE_2243_length_1197_cov_16_398100_g1859_i0_p2_GENE_NODE_2243_length_1197_cov_16_398100_g1859_i0NODE_2243_length_1197_cov_16_398100_g1859_i0_p2_ORF_typecomplete_len148_score28_59Trm112p/PF03966_16/7_2e19zf_C2H2_10/PF18414_1/0_12Zn_Tnp_IS1/PF03811_13/0_14zinc_ribbon_4/PF13717_6/0_14_NODE_2243_length_1197_cov_16_398100_g1859_i025468